MVMVAGSLDNDLQQYGRPQSLGLACACQRRKSILALDVIVCAWASRCRSSFLSISTPHPHPLLVLPIRFLNLTSDWYLPLHAGGLRRCLCGPSNVSPGAVLPKVGGFDRSEFPGTSDRRYDRRRDARRGRVQSRAGLNLCSLTSRLPRSTLCDANLQIGVGEGGVRYFAHSRVTPAS